LPDTEFVLGPEFSLVDLNALVFVLWARRLELDVARVGRYSALADRLLRRHSVQRALEQEGLLSAARTESA
jgi:glutathione S-transferase